MNPVQHAIDQASFQIPKRILNTIFRSHTHNWQQAPLPVSAQILNLVVRPRVLVDCRLMGGIEVIVALKGADIEVVENRNTVIRIPKESTNNRSIIEPLSIDLSFYSGYPGSNAILGGGYGMTNGNAALLAGKAALGAMGSAPLTSMSDLTLIGENTILVRNYISITHAGSLRCLVANDEHMSELPLRAYRNFTKLVVLAIKSFIYNEYILEMDAGELIGGQQLGMFKSIVEEYKDAEEMYQEFLATTWAKVAFMADHERMNRFIKMQVGPCR